MLVRVTRGREAVNDLYWGSHLIMAGEDLLDRNYSEGKQNDDGDGIQAFRLCLVVIERFEDIQKL